MGPKASNSLVEVKAHRHVRGVYHAWGTHAYNSEAQTTQAAQDPQQKETKIKKPRRGCVCFEWRASVSECHTNIPKVMMGRDIVADQALIDQKEKVEKRTISNLWKDKVEWVIWNDGIGKPYDRIK